MQAIQVVVKTKPEQKQTASLNANYDHCDTNAVLYQLSKFSTENLFILFTDCMRRLLYSEGFYPSRHIKVSSDPYAKYGNYRRVRMEGHPWCTGNSFGEWVQVDLGKTVFFAIV